LLGCPRTGAVRFVRRFKRLGCERFLASGHTRKLRVNEQPHRAALFALLHSPPSLHGVNRTTWRMADLRECLGRQGIAVGKDLILKIIRSAGYKWRKAKVLLTSNDPKYKEKLDRIRAVLGSLGPEERFFSIDEFGPFAVKMKGGRRRVAPNEYPSVPQHQSSKGCLILTAA